MTNHSVFFFILAHSAFLNQWTHCALLGHEPAHQLQVGFGVGVDVLFDGQAGSADAASRVLEGTVDHGRRAGVMHWREETKGWGRGVG